MEEVGRREKELSKAMKDLGINREFEKRELSEARALIKRLRARQQVLESSLRMKTSAIETLMVRSLQLCVIMK